MRSGAGARGTPRCDYAGLSVTGRAATAGCYPPPSPCLGVRVVVDGRNDEPPFSWVEVCYDGCRVEPDLGR